MSDAGGIVVSILAGVALAAAAGLRAFLPLLVLSLAQRFEWVHLHERFEFLGADVALVALIAASILEIAADKIPFVDHGLDAVATFVRPAVGFVGGLALMADLPEPVTVAMALLLAMISLGTHLEHAKVRAGSTLTTAGFGNPLISTVEDMVSGVLSFLAVLAPVLAVIVLFGVVYVSWRLWRRVRRVRVR